MIILVTKMDGDLYEIHDANNHRLSCRFHCGHDDLDDIISVLQTKAWVTHEHIDQLKDLVAGRQGVDL